MAKIKFTVIDESTISLVEDAKKGDIIDLSEVNELDLNVLSIRLIEKINGVAEEKANKLATKAKKDFEEGLNTKIELEKQKLSSNYEKALSKEREEKAKLENKIATFEQQKELEVTKAVKVVQDKAQSEKEKIQNQLNASLVENKMLTDKLSTQKSNYEMQTKILEEENKRIKEFKESRSTKMWGEDLEQFCLVRFEKDLRFAFPNAQFDKDNKVAESGKADFIFRDFTQNHNEYISIIFEMKNENPNSKNKQKNADFYNKLDKNRIDKNCKYAVLVSALEMDNPLFDEGIYKVPGYEDMFVIRPSFFTGLIKLLTTIQKNNRALVDEFETKKKMNLDLSNFEANFDAWKVDVNYNYELAAKKFATSIAEIDKTIAHLTAVKDNLLGLNKNLKIMNDKSQNMTIKKLTKNAPKVAELIEEGKDNNKK